MVIRACSTQPFEIGCHICQCDLVINYYKVIFFTIHSQVHMCYSSGMEFYHTMLLSSISCIETLHTNLVEGILAMT